MYMLKEAVFEGGRFNSTNCDRKRHGTASKFWRGRTFKGVGCIVDGQQPIEDNVGLNVCLIEAIRGCCLALQWIDCRILLQKQV